MRTNNNLEVDLIVEKGGYLFPYEFKLPKTPDRSMASPIERFINLFGKLHIRKGAIVSLCEETMELTAGVSLKTVDDFLSKL